MRVRKYEPPVTGQAGQPCPCCNGAGRIKQSFYVDLTDNLLWTPQKVVRVPYRQVEVLYAIAKRYPRTASIEAIISDVYGAFYDLDDPDGVVRTLVCHVRKRIEGTGLTIESERGRGYRLVEVAQ